jgi:hypothetical protein
LVAWLAVLLLVFGALAPTLSHALVWSQGGSSPWIEVCTPAGMRWVLLAPPQNAASQIGVATADSRMSTDSRDGPQSLPSLAHCPFCLLFTDRVAPAPNALLHLFVVFGEPGVPTLRQAFFFLTPYALTPPPRGPPASL